MITSDALLKRLLDLHPKVIDLSLDRMWRVLDALGNPQENLPPVIHIAGTNGKGSTQAMLRAGFEAMGKRVHAYTSPHLVHFHERIRLAGQLIDEEMLAALLAEVEEKNGGAPITFFEVTTAAAFLAFSRIPADVLLLEVGLGGRLDATNVMTPALSIITPVSMDHESYLGNSLEAIAGEKAGIIKAQVPAIIGLQEDEARQVIEERATELNAPALFQNQDFQSYSQNGRLVYQDEHGLWDLPLPKLRGVHQIDNAAMVLAALRHFDADENAAQAAMQSADWPARMQELKEGALVDLIKGGELWLDGGHNPAAGAMIADILEKLPPKPLVMICGMLNTKDVAGYLQNFAPFNPAFYAVSIEGEAATLSAEETSEAANGIDIAAKPMPSVKTALQAIKNPQEKRILICGSLYLAGKILRENNTSIG